MFVVVVALLALYTEPVSAVFSPAGVQSVYVVDRSNHCHGTVCDHAASQGLLHQMSGGDVPGKSWQTAYDNGMPRHDSYTHHSACTSMTQGSAFQYHPSVDYVHMWELM